MSPNGVSGVPTVEDMAGRIAANLARLSTDEEFAHQLREGKPSGNPIQLGPRLPSPENWTDLQIKGARDNAEKWLDRTVHPKKNFKEEALKPDSVAQFHDSMERVLREQRWEGGMQNVNESEALATVQALGSGIYSNAIEKRRAKILARNKELHDARLALAAEIDSLPTATDSDREAKMIANLRGLKAIGSARRGVS